MKHLKRTCAFLLVFALLLGVLPVAARGEEADFPYEQEDMEALYSGFSNLSDMFETMFFDDSALGYWRLANHMADSSVSLWLIDKANFIIGEKPDREYYLQVLTDLMALMEYDLAGQVQNQSQLDDLQGAWDQAVAVVDIAAALVGVDADGEPMGEIMSVLSEAKGALSNTVDELEHYELAIRGYACSRSFLKAVSKHTTNKDLKDAARDLLEISELLLKERVNALAGTAGQEAAFVAKTYLEEMSFSLLKGLKAYKTDKTLKLVADRGMKVVHSFIQMANVGSAVFKVIRLGGDVLFGTTNTFRRYNEMAAMADVARALTEAAEEVEVSESMEPGELFGAIRAKCDLYQMLLTVHARGEYLAYSLNYNDAGVLSMFSKFLDSFVKDKDNTIAGWYEDQMGRFEDYNGRIQALFASLGGEKQVVDRGFALHNGFIRPVDQKSAVPEGYVGIYTSEDFMAIARSCPSDIPWGEQTADRLLTPQTTANYILMNDITLPAGYDSAFIYLGVFDGNGYTIHGVNKPLFLRLDSATVKNLGLEVSADLDYGDDEVSFGAIAVTRGFARAKKDPVIDNCFVQGSIQIKARHGEYGALVANGEGFEITNCYNAADLRVTTRQSCYVGGLSGKNPVMDNCFNTGDIYGFASGDNTINAERVEVLVGGLVGYDFCYNIQNSYNAGDVTGESSRGMVVAAGGILGYSSGTIHKSVYIWNCYNTGDVTARWSQTFDPNATFGVVLYPTFSAGGINGSTQGYFQFYECWNSGQIDGDHFAGGILGYSNSVSKHTIQDCFNQGRILSKFYAGGLLGGLAVDQAGGVGMDRSYNVGEIASGSSRGSLAGVMLKPGDYVADCYYLDVGLPAVGMGDPCSGAKALSDQAMRDIASYEGFNFTDDWTFRSDSPYPVLR